MRVCVNAGFLLLLVGRGIVGQWYTIEKHKGATTIGGCVPLPDVTFDPTRCFRGRVKLLCAFWPCGGYVALWDCL